MGGVLPSYESKATSKRGSKKHPEMVAHVAESAPVTGALGQNMVGILDGDITDGFGCAQNTRRFANGEDTSMETSGVPCCAAYPSLVAWRCRPQGSAYVVQGCNEATEVAPEAFEMAELIVVPRGIGGRGA